MGDASPGGKQVGKVSIKVVPDATGFRKDLERQLRGKEKLKDVEVPVSGDVDEKQLVREVKSAVKAAGASVDIDAKFRKSALEEIQQYTKLLAVAGKDLDAIQGATRGLVGRVGLEVDPSSRLSWRAEIQSELTALRSLTFSLTPQLDPAGERQVLSQIAKLKPKLPPVDLDVRRIFVERNALPRAAAAINRSFAALASGASSALSGVGNLISTTVSTFGELGQTALSGVLKSAGRIAPLFIAIAAAIALVIPPVLALTAGLLALAPGFLAVLAPMGAIALGMDGIKRAAEKAGLFTDSNGDKQGGGKVGAALDAIKQKVSDTFEKGLEPAFNNIREMFLDTGFQNVFTGVADGLSKMASGFISAATTGKGLENVKGIIENVGTGLSNAAPGVEDFTNAILLLVNGISKKFGDMGTAFSGVMSQFLTNVEKFVTAVNPATGKTGLEQTMENVRDLINEVSGLITGVFANSMSDISDASFGENAKAFFASVKTFIVETMPQLSRSFETFAMLGRGIAAPFQFAADQLQRINDLIDKIPFARQMLELAGKAGKFAIESAMPAVGAYNRLNSITGNKDSDGTEEATKSLIDENAATAQAAAVAIAAKEEFDKTIASLPVDDQRSLLNAALGGDERARANWDAKLTNITKQAQDEFTKQFDGVKNAVTQKWTEINAAVTTGITNMETTISGFFTRLPLGFQGAFTGMQQSVTGMFIIIAQSISTQSANIENSFATAFAGIGPAVARSLANVPGSITNGLAPVRGAVATSMAEAAAAANEGGALTAQAAAASFGTVPPAISGALQPCITTVATVCGQMVTTALSYIGGMEAAGMSIGAAFAKGLANSTSLVIASASAVMGAAKAYFPNSPAKEGPFSGKGWVKYSGQAVGEDFAVGLDDSSKGVVSTTRELMQAVKDIFGDASGLTLNFNLGAAAMGSMAEDAQKFNSSMSSAASSLGTVKSKSGSTSMGQAAKIDTQSQAELDNLKWEQERLSVMQDMLGLQTRGASEAQKNEIKRQQDLLGLQKDRLSMQGKELEYWSKYEDKSRDYNDAWSAVGEKAQGALTDFGKSVGQQAMSDLGIGGQGAVSQLLTEGSKYVFNVMDMTSAMAAQKTFEQRESLTYTQR